jgi:hypothetical protein
MKFLTYSEAEHLEAYVTEPREKGSGLEPVLKKGNKQG